MTKFRDGFMMKSPLPKHNAIMDEMKAKSKESSGRDDAPDFSNAEVVKLKKDYDKAKAEHDSAAKMSPFQGYVDGEERVSHYQPTADLYQGLVDTLTSNVDKIASSKKDKEKDSFKKAGKRVDEIADTGVDYKFGETLNDGMYAVGNKSKKENTFQKYLNS
tara:strand:+ start:146 stop:628 length:483 start_codon:yes stop_codon:yes gene_type:complete